MSDISLFGQTLQTVVGSAHKVAQELGIEFSNNLFEQLPLKVADWYAPQAEPRQRSSSGSSSAAEVNLPQLPEVIYSRGICLKGKTCSLARTLDGFYKSIKNELNNNLTSAHMLCWAIAMSLPDNEDLFKGTRQKAINEHTQWRGKPKKEQVEAYKQLAALEEFAEFMAPLDELLKETAERKPEDSPLIQALAAHYKCDPIELTSKRDTPPDHRMRCVLKARWQAEGITIPNQVKMMNIEREGKIKELVEKHGAAHKAWMAGCVSGQ